MKISIEDARRFLVRHQHLSDTQPLLGKQGCLEYIKKVGCIQFDPLNVIGRNADLVLQSRISDYRQEMLAQLLYEDRSLVDAWDKVMSIYSVDDWPYFHFVREQRGKETIATLQYRDSTDALNYVNDVIEALAKNGALQPKQIGLGSTGSGTWGHRNIYSAAMDYLFHVGKIGVSKKLNVNKVYDLIENLLPAHILERPSPFSTEHDFFKWYISRRLGSIGMLWNRNGGGWLGTLMPNKTTRQRILDEMVDEGTVTAIEVEGIAEKFYARSCDISFESEEPFENRAMKFIAPLDNLIWDRDMTAKIFGFEYTWEVYVPAVKRKYGYYVLPVLYDNRLVARFDPEKSASHFYIKNWWWEKDVNVTGDLIDAAIQAMERFALCFDKKKGVQKSVRKKLRS